MKIDDIIDMWQSDVKIDETELSRESLNIPLLHGKYLKYFSQERLKLRAQKMKQKQLQQLKQQILQKHKHQRKLLR